MCKHAIACLFGAVLLVLFVVIPLDRYLHLDSQGRRMQLKAVPPSDPKHELYRAGWWKDEASVLEVRRRFRHQTDAEFLSEMTPGSDAYRSVAAVLQRHPSPQRCPLQTPRRPAEGTGETFQAAR